MARGNTRVRIRRDQIKRLLDGYTVQLQTGVGVLDLRPEAEEQWRPLRQLIPVPLHITRQKATLGQNGEPVRELWRNAEYEVWVYYLEGGTRNGLVHLSIKRMDRAAIRNWRHFQQIKNEVLGPEREGVELFPRESRLADNANQYHLWVAPRGADFPLGWETAMVVIDPEEVDAFNAAPHSGRQEPMQPGLTVGVAVNNARPPEDVKVVRRMLGVPTP